MGHRLLVVDSDRRFLQDHKASLESAFEVEFRDGTEGSLALLECGDFAAVLLCVEASENKGYSLCSAIRRSPVLADLKVALISAKATEEEYARHRSLKGRADLYLHKPIRPNALVSALSPFVPLKPEDPDNPLGDMGGTDLGDEWLESLRSELEVDAVPHVAAPRAEAPRVEPAAPAPQPPALAPVSVLLGLGRPLLPLPAVQYVPAVPKDAGRVELLEARVQDLETKLVALSDEVDHRDRALEELGRQGEAAQGLLEERTRAVQELETRLAEAEAARERSVQELEELRQSAEVARNLLAEKNQLAMDVMESNQLLQAQLAEAREEAERLSRSERELLAQVQELETARNDSLAAQEQLQGSLADLHRQMADQEVEHDRQQMELMAAVDDRDARLARTEGVISAQREQIQLLEQEKVSAGEQILIRSNRLLALQDHLAELENQTRLALDLAKAEIT
jgi:CheY-like chemotaxis protein